MVKIIPSLLQMRSDNKGAVLVLVALVLPALVGAAGLGIDTIQWTLTQRQMQRTADSAALAGAFGKAQGASASASATKSIQRDNIVVMTEAPIIQNAPTRGPYTGNTNAVRVILKTRKALPFSSLFLAQGPLISVEATASAVTNGTFCVISLENTSETGINMQGSASVDLGCGMATNSGSAQAVTADGSSYVAASPIAAVGGLTTSSNYAPGTVLLPRSVPQRDPYLALPAPTLPSCSGQLNVNPDTSRNVTNPTGVTCYRGMNLNGTVNFAPGIYYIDGGSLSFGAQAVVTGTNVTFILTSATAPSNPNSIATLDMNGSARINLTAKATGTYAGVLIYQDRRAPNSSPNKINGNSSSSFQGAFYLPSQGVNFSGNSGMNTGCVQIVSRRVTFTGNSDIRNECPSDSGAGSFAGTRVFLVG